MKTELDCLPCYLKQALRVARMQGLDEKQQERVVLAVSRLLADVDLLRSPPENAVAIYAAVAEITDCIDPYLEAKRIENKKALNALPALRRKILTHADPLNEAIQLAIAGNIIDYGVSDRFDLDEMFNRLSGTSMTIDDRPAFQKAIASAGSGGAVLYLADNCGEIVYDSLVIELLAAAGLTVTVAVKELPIINDALLEDALSAGVGEYAEIISNGTGCPGTPLASCSPEFQDLFASADLVVSKGQGNFETLSEIDRDVFFFLTVKCEMVGKHLAELSGIDHPLPGNGEMVVYHSVKK